MMKLHTLAALLASTIAAAAVAAPSTATSTLPPGVKDMSPDQIDYNLQAIDAAAKEPVSYTHLTLPTKLEV